MTTSKTRPLLCVPTAFAAKTLTFLAFLRFAKTLLEDVQFGEFAVDQARAQLVLSALQILLAKEPPKRGRTTTATKGSSRWNRIGLTTAELQVAIRQSARLAGRDPPHELPMLAALLHDVTTAKWRRVDKRRRLHATAAVTSLLNYTAGCENRCGACPRCSGCRWILGGVAGSSQEQLRRFEQSLIAACAAAGIPPPATTGHQFLAAAAVDAVARPKSLRVAMAAWAAKTCDGPELPPVEERTIQSEGADAIFAIAWHFAASAGAQEPESEIQSNSVDELSLATAVLQSLGQDRLQVTKSLAS